MSLASLIPVAALLALVVAADRAYEQNAQRSKEYRCVEQRKPYWPGESYCRSWGKR